MVGKLTNEFKFYLGFHSFFSVLFVFLVFVTIYMKEESKEDIQMKIDRTIIYAKRLKQIKKACKKYGLSASEEENIQNSKFKKIQSEFSRSAIPPYSDKVHILYALQFQKYKKKLVSFFCRVSSCILKTTHCSIAGLIRLLLLHGTKYFLRKAT